VIHIGDVSNTKKSERLEGVFCVPALRSDHIIFNICVCLCVEVSGI
jgi:hypothetical protein